MPNNPFLYFDIETGGLDPSESGILSISHARGEEKGSLYAKPTGKMSDWVLTNVWNPIRARLGGEPTSSEEDVLRSFLGTLQSHRGGTIAGWNIGYVAAPMDKGSRGFDIPFIMSRAQKYGLHKEFSEAFSNVSIRDIGREHSVRIAQEVAKYPTLVDPDLYAQAASFNKLVEINKVTQRLHTVPEISEWMGTPGKYGGYQLAGWKIKDVYQSMFGESISGHHESEQDVIATRRIAEEGDLSRLTGPEYVKSWNATALANKAAASARARETEGVGGKFYARAAARVAETPWMRQGLRFVGEHRWGIGIGLGVAALFAIKPLQYFSGKDDDYNTIEGLRHGGQAEKMRHRMTDFGSGWVRKALSKGVAKEEIVSAAFGRLGLGKHITGMAGEFESLARQTVQGSTVYTGKQLGKGGMGVVSEAFEAGGAGRTGIWKDVGPVQKFEEGTVVQSPAFKHMGGSSMDSMIMNPDKNAFFEGYTVPASRAWVRTAKEYGGVGARSEYELQKLAHQQYGKMVPEAYGHSETGIFMESAGKPIAGGEEEIKALQWLQKEWKTQLNKAPVGGEGIYHLDPQIKNIMKKGDEYKLIDWGVATKEQLSPEARQLAEKEYEGYITARKRDMMRAHQGAVSQAAHNAKYGGKGHTMKAGKMPNVEMPTAIHGKAVARVKTLVEGPIPTKKLRR